MLRMIMVFAGALLPLVAVAGEGFFIEAGAGWNHSSGEMRYVEDFDGVSDRYYYPKTDPIPLEVDHDYTLEATDRLGLGWNSRSLSRVEFGLGYWLNDEFTVTALLDWWFAKKGDPTKDAGRVADPTTGWVNSTTTRRGAGLDVSWYPFQAIFLTLGARYNRLDIETDESHVPHAFSGFREVSEWHLSWRTGLGLAVPLREHLDLIATAAMSWAKYKDDERFGGGDGEYGTADAPPCNRYYAVDFSGPEVSLKLRRGL
mgnify:CR=1 FL=1